MHSRSTLVPSFLLAVTILVAGCAGTTPGPGDPTVEPRLAAAMLTEREALRRAASVSNVAYQLSVALGRSPSAFSGTVELSFDYAPQPGLLTIDFDQGTVEKLLVNGSKLDYEYNGFFISLPAAALRAGRNRVEIAFSRPYSMDGSGFYRFEDPADGRVYLYTDFQPYSANRLFPHFDQPDLKARFTLRVSAPRQWIVVSTTRENRVVEEGDFLLWHFATSEPISSYVFSLHAGEYAVWEDPDFRYPLRLLARQGLADTVKWQEWLAYTRAGFDFFESYFELAYPFGKYDQLLVPDYNEGAMENVAAVTFSEWFSRSGETTRYERQQLAETIYHEMAHMWFGDIATMRWWNGLWLNESFATLMAYLALAEQPEFANPWHQFFLTYKRWAYREDQWVTTHPIEVAVEDTDQAEVLFDGITYAKGSSVLQQLTHYLGANGFRQGVRDYLRDNAYGSTELEDFIGALESAVDRPLQGWTNRWLKSAGLNSVTPRLTCRAGRIQSLALEQQAEPEYPQLREQTLQLALFERRDGRLQPRRVEPVLLEAQPLTAIRWAAGEPCPALVYANLGDWGYLKMQLDERSLNTVRHHVNTLEDAQLRSMLWNDLWQMVSDAELPLGDYLQILAANLAGERDTDVIRTLLYSLRRANNLLHILPQGEYVQLRYQRIFEPLIWRRVTEERGDDQKTWFDAYVAMASQTASIERLQRLLQGELAVPGLELDQRRRWAIIARLRELRVAGSNALLEAEAASDNSALGHDLALYASVIGAAESAKPTWLEEAIRNDDGYQLQRSRTILRALYPPSQRYLMATEADRLVALIPSFNSERDIKFSRYLGYYLLPALCNADNVARLARAIDANPGLNAALRQALLITHQAEQRCVAMGELVPSGPPG
jgi:aminopeptidase N